jgi:hypothetical protein
LRPSKNRAGNRTYRQKDIDFILKIKDLLYREKYTIEGARIAISKKNQRPTEKLGDIESKNLLISFKSELEKILQIINN